MSVSAKITVKLVYNDPNKYTIAEIKKVETETILGFIYIHHKGTYSSVPISVNNAFPFSSGIV